MDLIGRSENVGKMQRNRERKDKINNMVHVSFDLVEEFTPRVPAQRGPNEDDTIPRICVAPDINSALQAIPQAGETINAMKTLEIPIIIHAYYLKSDCVLLPEQIADKVGDAIATGEMWIMEKPQSVYRVDYEIINSFIITIEDMYGTIGKFIIGGDKRRVRFQDNWWNLAKAYCSGPTAAKRFMENKPDISFRTLMSNLDDDTYEMKQVMKRMK